MGPNTIDFNNFKVNCPDYRISFEKLCYHLFLRENKIPNGVFAHFNEAGLETIPVKVQGKWVGFQAKFFEPKIDYAQIEKSVHTAIKKHGANLDIIYIYLNLPMGSTGKVKPRIEKYAKENSIEIKWIVPSHFEAQLILPSNYDLAQIYFGSSDEISFASSLSSRIITFLKSKEFQQIPFLKEGKQIKDFEKSISSNSSKINLVVGQPGSGKSYYMHRLLFITGGMHKSKKSQQNQLLNKNGSLPMLVNLKDCLNQSLESIIRDRQNDYNVRGSALGFTYIFDGLDELNKDRADSVLSMISDLETLESTKKIIVSCRSGNPNRYVFKKYFSESVTYEISNLSTEHTSKYFKDLGDENKIKLLDKFIKKDALLLKEINDIFLLKLFWDTLETISDKHSIINLFELKITQMMSDARHQKNIHSLNLLNPKQNQIILLNQEISYQFQQKFQYRFSNTELQQIIQAEYPLLTYEDTNQVFDYLCSHFFVSSGNGDDVANNTYIYQHRRYQEFFFVQRLKKEYELKRTVLRSKFLANKEFIEEIFLPYLEQKYNQEGNLPRLLEMSLIRVYLGMDGAYGSDDPYFELASNFSKAISCQENSTFDELINDENLDLQSKLPATIQNINQFWKNNKKDYAEKLVSAFDKYRDNAKIKAENGDTAMNEQLDREIWGNLQEWFTMSFTFYKNDLIKYFKNTVRPYYKKYADEKSFDTIEVSRGEQLLIAFYIFCIKENPKDWDKLLKILEDEEKLILAIATCDISLIPKIFSHKLLMTTIRDTVQAEITDNKQVKLLFYKKIFNHVLSQNEIKLAEETLGSLQNERSVDWHFRNTNETYALISYALTKHQFKQTKKKDENRFSYYNELILFASLFNAYINLLRSKNKNIGSIIKHFITYSNNNDKPRAFYLTYEVSKLWADIFNCSANLEHRLLTYKSNLFDSDLNINYKTFLLEIREKNPKLYRQLTNESEVDELSNKLITWEDDIPRYVEYCFDLSILYSELNAEKSQQFIAEGVYEGILRHGWRKDSIVSYNLIDALEILMRNNWLSNVELNEYIDAIFTLTIKVTDITDGKGTWRGPYNLIELVAQYDIENAVRLRDKLAEEKGRHNLSLEAYSSIIIQKVYRGIDISQIQNELEDINVTYGYQGKPQSDAYEHKIKVWLTVTEEDLYSPSEKKQAFINTYSLIKELKEKDVDYFLSESDYEHERNVFIKLCKKYKKENLLEEVQSSTSFYKKPKMANETKVVSEIKKIKTKRALKGFYTRLANYNKRIVLSENNSWKILIDKTYEITGDIELLFSYFKSEHYPRTDFFTENSEHLHYPLSYALSNIKTRNQTMEFLYWNGGYQGFLNVMRAFELNGDKKMCLKLFKNFYGFCDFIVN